MHNLLNYKRVYLEITNVCNLSCSFCPKSLREGKFMNFEEFDQITDALHGVTEYLYFHIKGEPLLHPLLPEFLSLCEKKDFFVNITSNGTLLREQEQTLLTSKALRKVSLSLQSFEGDKDSEAYDDYMKSVSDFAQKAAAAGKFIEIRQWDYQSNEITREELFHSEKIADRIYLSKGHYFEWPNLQNEEKGRNGTCHGLRNQIGVLVDGTVVPCCLDQEGDLALGNIFVQELETILRSERSLAIVEGFRNRKLIEPLCRTCGYIQRF